MSQICIVSVELTDNDGRDFSAGIAAMADKKVIQAGEFLALQISQCKRPFDCHDD
jgi:hypothetical protein